MSFQRAIVVGYAFELKLFLILGRAWVIFNGRWSNEPTLYLNFEYEFRVLVTYFDELGSAFEDLQQIHATLHDTTRYLQFSIMSRMIGRAGVSIAYVYKKWNVAKILYACRTKCTTYLMQLPGKNSTHEIIQWWNNCIILTIYHTHVTIFKWTYGHFTSRNSEHIEWTLHFLFFPLKTVCNNISSIQNCMRLQMWTHVPLISMLCNSKLRVITHYRM